MKEEKMLRAIGGIDDDMVEDAAIHPSHKKRSLVRMPAFRRVVAIVACFVLIIGLAFSMPTLLTPNNDGPGVPIEPGTLLPPNVQENESNMIQQETHTQVCREYRDMDHKISDVKVHKMQSVNCDTAEESDMMKRVNDLMVTGYSGEMNFDRDFVAEGIEMLNRFSL